MEQSEYFEKVSRWGKEMRGAGLDIFDLFSWEYLLDLRDRTRDFIGIDLDIHADLKNSVERVLRRKAEMLDARDDSNFYKKMLGRMGL
ncbi:MAG: hypothetical protein WAP23_01195 [Candidatus Spechtbacterales bacterium]